MKSAEDKASRGTRALEIAVDAVSSDIKALDNASAGAASASPEVVMFSKYICGNHGPRISNVICDQAFLLCILQSALKCLYRKLTKLHQTPKHAC